MDEESLRGKNEGEGQAAPEPLLRSQSFCSMRGSIASVVEEHDECHSLAHLGVLIPLYLLPLLFVGIQFGGCLYSLLLPLLLWAFNAVPKPAAAVVHLVTLPLLGLMSPEQVASQYLGGEVLIVVLLMFALVVMDAWSDVVHRFAHGICIRFGLRRGPLFAVVCMCAFVSACLFSGLVVSAALLYFLDRVMFTIFKEDLDRTADVSSSGILRSSQHETSYVHRGDQVLFDRLARAMLTLKKPERRFFRRKKKNEDVAPPAASITVTPQDERELMAVAESRQEDVERAAAASSIEKPADNTQCAIDPAHVPGSSTETFERADAESTIETERKVSQLSRWRRKYFQTQPTPEPQPTIQALANPEGGQLTSDFEKALEERAKQQDDIAPTQPVSPPAAPSDLATGAVVDGRHHRVHHSHEKALKLVKPLSGAGKEVASENAALLSDESKREHQPEPPEVSRSSLRDSSGNRFLTAKPDFERRLGKAASSGIDIECATSKLTTQDVPCATAEIDNTFIKVADNKIYLSGSKQADRQVIKVIATSTLDQATVADNNTGRSAEASKVSRNKVRPEKDRSSGSKKGKRSGKKRNGIKEAVYVSEQPSTGPPNKDGEQHRTQGFSVRASELEGDMHNQASGCNVPHLIQGDQLEANNNQSSFPGQHQSSQSGDDCRRNCGEQVSQKPSEPEASKPAAAKSDEPEVKLERAQGNTRELDEQAQSKGSKMSKSSVKGSRKSGRKSTKGHSGEAKKAVKVAHDIESLPEAKRSGKQSPARAAASNKDQVVGQPEAIISLENATGMPSFAESQSAKKPPATESTSDKLKMSSVLSTQKTQDTTGNTNAQAGTPAEFRGTMSQARRKQSGVSFGAGVKELQDDELSPIEEADKAFVPPDEASSKSTQKRRLSTILKSSTSAVVRRPSTVDFGPEKCAFISPTLTALNQRPPRRQSALSGGSISSLGESDAREPCRRSYSLRRAIRTRSSLFEESLSRTSISGRPSMIGSQFGSMTRKTKEASAREDVHNAFLLGPSLMCVLGGICSFIAGGNKKALWVVAQAADVTFAPMSSVTWAMVTLPGTMLALVSCSWVIWLLYVSPHDPDPFSPENLSVMRAAQERHAGRQRQRGVELASTVYMAIFSLAYAPSLFLGIDPRLALLGALASMLLATSLLTSCMRAAFDFVRQIWALLPWGILLLLGATQVASRLMQVYDLPREAFKMVSPMFWKERSSVEVQAILGLAASLLAETADKQVLIEMMAPVVAHVAEIRGVYPTYYAIPVIVGASSNVVMPASPPLAILHEFARVPFVKLVLLGLFIKTVVISMAIMTVNIASRADVLVNAAAE